MRRGRGGQNQNKKIITQNVPLNQNLMKIFKQLNAQTKNMPVL
jgi:hypothetical protein